MIIACCGGLSDQPEGVVDGLQCNKRITTSTFTTFGTFLIMSSTSSQQYHLTRDLFVPEAGHVVCFEYSNQGIIPEIPDVEP